MIVLFTPDSVNQKRIMFKYCLLIALSLSAGFSLGCHKKPSSEETFKVRMLAFKATQQENLQATKWDIGDTTTTNEDRLDLFQPHVANLGGGYVGVGSTQNFTLAAWAKSDWIWLMDFTRIVVWTNRVNIAFLKVAKTPKEFRDLWIKKNKEKAFEIIEKEYANDPELNDYKRSWEKSQWYQDRRFKIDDKIYAKRQIPLWLYVQENYDHIRSLALRDSILSIKGNLKGDTTVLSIAQTAKKMGVPIRVAYFSNAEEYFVLGESFRRNWKSIPFDEKSVVIRTISVYRNKFPWAEDSHYSTDRGFHYAIQPGINFQKWLTDSGANLRSQTILAAGDIHKEGYTVIKANPPESHTTKTKQSQ